MKKLFLLLAYLLLVSITCVSQTENWNMLTLQRELYSINFLSQNKVWIFAGDYSYKSIDGGIHWSNPAKNNVNIGISGGSYFTYPNHICFIDSLYGWLTQNDNLVYKTTNGGVSWYSHNTNFTGADFVCVQFVNRQLGFIAGQNGNFGIIAKTTNGGVNWNMCQNTIKKPITSLYILDSLKGIASGSYYDTLTQTSDGWNSIEYKKAGIGQGINKIFFLDSVQGWLLGNPGFISKTTNSGVNWQVMNVSLGNTVNMYFVNTLTGWVTSTRKRIFKTTNGGSNWFSQISLGTNDTEVFRDIYFKNPDTGWALGTLSQLLKTTNGGINWVDEFNNPSGSLNTIFFTNLNTGWCSSSIGLWITTNRGYNWLIDQSLINSSINSIEFINDNTGFLCGNTGNFFKTSNRGVNWSISNISENNLFKLTFINSSTGFVCGANGTILKTINYGINWVALQSNFAGSLNDIQFIGQDTGYIAAANGYILKTVNSGINWNLIFPYNLKVYRSIYFINSKTGFAVGDSHTSGPPYPSSALVIIKTTDGGLSWTRPIDQNLTGNYYFNDIFFINGLTGWLVSMNNGSGYISKSTDSGLSWYQIFGPLGNGFVPGGLNSIYAITEDNVWVAGNVGSTISTSSPIGLITTQNEIPKYNFLSQNYPNPFNPQTKIKFDIPVNAKGQTSNVKLVVYDLLGREVSTLVNEELKPGSYEADWDGSNFSSGVYFYKIIAGDFVETKKMVLMK